MSRKIIGISGISGAGKTTLVNALSQELNTSTLFWDDFDAVSKYPDDYGKWFDLGKDDTAFDYSDLADALIQLHAGNDYWHPVLKKKMIASPIVIADLPLGRFHKQTAQHVDLFVHLDVPLDIALC